MFCSRVPPDGSGHGLVEILGFSGLGLRSVRFRVSRVRSSGGSWVVYKALI